jgi:hypothetical protein
MIQLTIRIQSKEDAKQGPAFPEIEVNDKKIYDLAVQKVSVLQGGMKSGKTSIGLISEAYGSVIMMQLSADQLEMIYAAVRGAEMRWAEQQTK